MQHTDQQVSGRSHATLLVVNICSELVFRFVQSETLSNVLSNQLGQILSQLEKEISVPANRGTFFSSSTVDLESLSVISELDNNNNNNNNKTSGTQGTFFQVPMPEYKVETLWAQAL